MVGEMGIYFEIEESTPVHCILGSVILFEFSGGADPLNQSLDCTTQFSLGGGLQAF